MKTPEDEAFDELAKRQGAWGGGFPAKRQMAMDKLQEPDKALTLEALKYAASKGYGRIVRENSAPFIIKEALAQPAQEQHWNKDEWRRNNWRCGHGWLRGEQCEICNTPLPVQEPVACVQDLDEVKRKHLVYEKGMDWKDPLYAAPPQREWVGLTEEERNKFDRLFQMSCSSITVYDQICRVEAKLKEKNNG